MTSNKLWTPQKVLPTVRKHEGGSYFDDELEDTETLKKRVINESARMLEHLQRRPDHAVYVGSTKDREQMRTVMNHFFNSGLLNHHPTIKIDYGVPEGGIRIDEDRR